MRLAQWNRIAGRASPHSPLRAIFIRAFGCRLDIHPAILSHFNTQALHGFGKGGNDVFDIRGSDFPVGDQTDGMRAE